jgi:hypothetical protein
MRQSLEDDELVSHVFVDDGIAPPFAGEGTDDPCGHLDDCLGEVDGFSRGLLAEDVRGEESCAWISCG